MNKRNIFSAKILILDLLFSVLPTRQKAMQFKRSVIDIA